MPIAINPVFPVIAAQDLAPGIVLQPGSVIDARVVRLLQNDLVRIAIASLSIDVLSEVPLKVGQTLQLAVSETAQGIRLQIVPPALSPSIAPAQQPSVASYLSGAPDVKPDAIVSGASMAAEAPDIAAVRPAVAMPIQVQSSSSLPSLAVPAAIQAAAARQNSLAPLFANLAVAASLPTLPPALTEAVRQLLALRPELGPSLTGDVIKLAFQQSGLFLERSLSTLSAAPLAVSMASNPESPPDMKAAMLVLRQVLGGLFAAQPVQDGATPSIPVPSYPQTPLADGGRQLRTPSAMPPLPPDENEVVLPQASLLVSAEFAEPDARTRVYTPLHLDDPAAQLAGTGRMTGSWASAKEVLVTIAAMGDELASSSETIRPLPSSAGGHSPPVPGSDEVALSNMPAPPFRGAATVAQPTAQPSLTPDASSETIVRRLFDDTDAALARQTLLQTASLPDRADVQATRPDLTGPRWNFEIPFATPFGTSIAQFEISRDGRGTGVEAARRIWRARFSIDLEPAGPVHAIVSLTDGVTSVRMWAERPLTATRLRVNAAHLSDALRTAELEPGDIVVRLGTPPPPAQPLAGHFLDRAL